VAAQQERGPQPQKLDWKWGDVTGILEARRRLDRGNRRATMNALTTAASDVLVDHEGGIVRLTLNRAAKRNALSKNLLTQLEEALHEIEAGSTARVVVLAANGPVFSAGHDLSEMVGCTQAEYQELFATCTRVMQQLRRLAQPVIARVHGLATAAGCQLVAACDLVVAAEGARFATPGVKIGLFCTTPMVPLVRAIPAKPAFEMLTTGNAISAQRAYELGLVNRVVPEAELDAAVQQYVDAIVASSPLIIRIGKAAFYDQLALDESTAYARATDVIIDNVQRRDAQEGISAFLEKRPPTWTGE
jgi:enoyl-CoA hydratase/carnithine racemase